MACRSIAGSSARTHIISICWRPIHPSRFFSTTRCRRADEPIQPSSSTTILRTTAGSSTHSLATRTTAQPSSRLSLSVESQQSSQKSSPESNPVLNILSSVGTNLGGSPASQPQAYGLTSALDKYKSPSGPRRLGDDEYHLHVYSHRRNTHLTLADTERKSLISISTGNLGFQKSNRGTFDAGYQLMTYMLSRIQQQGLMPKIQKLELCLRGWGPGRDAVEKVLLGREGTRLRELIVRVVDKTRLKIGGNRSPKPRRL